MSDLRALGALSKTADYTNLVGERTNYCMAMHNNVHTHAAAKVLILQKLPNPSHCKHAYQVEVLQQFNLSSPTKHGATYAPLMPHHSIIHTSPYNCNACPNFTVGCSYLIAGQYHTGDDGMVIWELPNKRSQSLASAWKGRIGENYDKKLAGWIADANEHKLQMSAN